MRGHLDNRESVSPISTPSLALEPRLQIGQDRVERGAERNQETPMAFAIAAAADIAFPETRCDPPEIMRKATDIATVAQILRPRGRVAVEPAQHVGDIAVDLVDQAR